MWSRPVFKCLPFSNYLFLSLIRWKTTYSSPNFASWWQHNWTRYLFLNFVTFVRHSHHAALRREVGSRERTLGTRLGPEKGASSDMRTFGLFLSLVCFFSFIFLFFVLLNYFVHFYFLWGSWFWVTGKQLSAAEIRWCPHFRFWVLESWPCCGCLKSRETTKGSIKYLLHEAKKLALINTIGSLLYLFHTVRGYRSTNIVKS